MRIEPKMFSKNCA